MGAPLLFLFCAVLASRGAIANAAEPVAPKLTDQGPAPAVVAETLARALPRALVICIDRAGKRCWDGERVADCGAAGGRVFAAMPADGGDPGAMLRACWDQLR